MGLSCRCAASQRALKSFDIEIAQARDLDVYGRALSRFRRDFDAGHGVRILAVQLEQRSGPCRSSHGRRAVPRPAMNRD